MPVPIPRFLSFLATAPRFSRRERPARRFPHDSADFGIAAEVLEDRRLLATFVVNDDGGGDFNTIQTAIDAAAAGDTILINGGADRIHTEQGVNVNKSVTIQGELGETQVIVQAAFVMGTATESVFRVQEDVTAAIDNLTVRHGRLGIFNAGSLTINGSTITRNRVDTGVQAGGIFTRGNLTILNSSITDNTGSQGGGGIVSIGSFLTPHLVEIRNSEISNNDGAGITTAETQLAISHSRIQDNTRAGILLFTSRAEISSTLITGNMDGINAGASGLTLVDSTVAGNQESGVGLVDSPVPSLIVNSTISQNGIGVFLSGTNIDITNSTITANGAGIVGTPTATPGLSTSLDLTSTIVAGNGDAGGPEDLRLQGVILQAMSNLIGDAGSSGGIVHGQNGNIVGNNGAGTLDINTILDTTLRDNGGPTPTHALVSGSPAVNAGLNPFDLPFDQRGSGFPRTQLGQTDIGAVESPFFPPSLVPVLAVGTGGGIPAQVRVFNSALDEVFRLLPYGDFAGGVRIALGDVTGDGVTDVVTAAGTGGGPHIKVFDGIDGREIQSFFAFDAAFLGGVYVALADLNEDGRADIITGAGEGGGPHVRAFSGLDGSLLFDFFAFNLNFRGGVRVAASDISFDGRPDIITSAGPGGGPHVRVFDGTNPLLAAQGINIPGPLGSFFAYETTYTGGVFVAADNTFVFPDDTPDGPFLPLVAVPNRPVIITGSGLRAGGPSVGLFSPFGPPEYFQLPLYSEARVALLDVNQDGFNDYLTATGPGANGQVQILSGNDSGTLLPFGPTLLNFFPFGELYRGGIFVAGSI